MTTGLMKRSGEKHPSLGITVGINKVRDAILHDKEGAEVGVTAVVGFLATKRLDARLILPETIKVLKMK